MVQALDERDSAQAKPVALRAKTSALLSGLVCCGEHLDDEAPVRACTAAPCRAGPATTARRATRPSRNFEHVVVEEFLRQKGERVRWTVVEEVHEGGAALLPEIEHRLDELDELIRQAPDRDARQRLQAEQGNLLDLRDEKRAEAPNVVVPASTPAQTFGRTGPRPTTVEDRRAILDDAIERVMVRGRPGRRTDAQVLARLTFDWKRPEDLGAAEMPDDSTLAAWAGASA